MSGIYIHIPFCKQACSYCDFYFVTRTAQKGDFVERLIKEIQSYDRKPYNREQVRTIYFGGGTPSLLDAKQIERILEELYRIFPLEVQELTFEVNPDDVTAEFLSALNSLGITRLSMGVQSFQPELLEFMNRAHSREEALRCLELLRSSEFDVYTADLIYGNPNQSLEQLRNDLDQLLAFNPPHVSAYSLTIESNTRLGKQVELGRIVPKEEGKVANHFDLVNKKLSEQGIERYEVSNYSQPGAEAVHNSSYWHHENYLGLGPGAHSFWWGEEAQRWHNERNLRAYLEGKKIRSETEELIMEQLAEERLLMGLRTRRGVSIEELNKRYQYSLNGPQKDYLNRRESEQKLVYDNRIRLTNKGIKIADAIILDVITLH